MDIDEFYPNGGHLQASMGSSLAACRGEELDLFFDPDAVDFGEICLCRVSGTPQVFRRCYRYGDLGVLGRDDGT